MVLIQIAIVALLAACSQSLFDANDRRDANATLPSTCPAPCIADAAGDFDGSEGGANGRWRYLDDFRARAWLPMTAAGSVMMGSDPKNTITTCAARPAVAACAALPGALLMSSSSSLSNADPAIEFTAPDAQVLALSLHVHLPAGAPEQLVRLYRNSREDVLATLPATAGTTVETTLTLDALAGDRFLVAIVPSAMGAADVGVHLFASATGAAFPSTCQLAASFGEATGTTVANLCGGSFAHEDYNTGPIAPVLGDGPYVDMDPGADLAPDQYYAGERILDKSGDLTVQLWVRHDALVAPYTAWAFSDFDLDNGGGLGIAIYDAGRVQLEVGTCTSPDPLAFAGERTPYPVDGEWHFIRVVHQGDTVTTCVDGVRAMSFAAPAGSLASTFRPHLGKNVVWTPAGAFFDGGLDDVRVFSGALPCD